MRWAFNYEKATSVLSRQPAQCPAGAFPLLMGVDGRYEGTLRRYPGHIHYPDSSSALGSAPSASDFQPDLVKYFEIQKQPGSTDKIRGFVVGELSTGKVEFWYKFSTDADGVIRKYSLVTNGGSAFRWNGSAMLPMASSVDDDTTSFVSQISCWCLHDDGNGVALYAGGEFRVIGDRNAYCIAKWDGRRWTPVPGARFNAAVLTMHSGNAGDGVTRLYLGGSFTKNGSSNCRRIAVWNNKDTFSEVLNGVVNGSVLALTTKTSGSNQGLWVGGNFTSVDNGTPTTATGLAIYDTSASWTVFAGADALGGNADVYSMVSTGGTIYVGGDFTTADGGATTVNHIMACTSVAGPAVALGTGLGSAVCFTLLLWDDGTNGTDLFAGGTFSSAGGVANTASVARWDIGGSAWAALGSGLTGSVLSLANFNDGGGDRLYAAGSNITGGGVDIQKYSGSAWGNATALTSTSLPTRAILGWGGYLHFGGNNFSTALTLNPLLLGNPVGGTAPTEYWDITTRGRYLYFMTSNGVKKTIYWDQATSAFLVKSFGPGVTYSPPVAVANLSAASGGRLIVGNYQTSYRYRDVDRARYTALSEANPDQAATANQKISLNTNAAFASTVFSPPPGYNKGQMFSAISSGDAAVAGGGTQYVVVEGSLNSNRLFLYTMGSTTFTDDGNGTASWALSDVGIPGEDRQYDPIDELVGEVGSVYACATFGSMLVCLEDQDGYLNVRWSNPTRLEPENFQPQNVYRTSIPVSDALSCKITFCNDFMYITGGGRVYRLQKAGRSVGVVSLYEDEAFLHRQAVVKVLDTIYIGCESGLLTIDGRTGAVQMLPVLDRIFHDRWRGQLLANDNSKAVSFGYDARMKCLYVLSKPLREMVCIWLSTGKVTVQPLVPADTVASGTDLDDEAATRAYFFTNRRWISVPNWKGSASSEAMTMNGTFLYTGQSSIKYNPAITTVTNSSAGPNVGGSHTKLTFGSSVHPFSTAGSSGTLIEMRPLYVVFLTGARKHEAHKVVDNDSDELWLEGNLTTSAPVSGDVVALGSPVFGVVGSALWTPRGYIQPLLRCVVSGATCMVGRVLSKGHANHQATTPTSATYGFIRHGIMRPENVIANEPYDSDTETLLSAYQSGEANLGLALDVDKPSNSWNHKKGDGTMTFPFLMCLHSNLQFDLHHWEISGEQDLSEVSGPGTF